MTVRMPCRSASPTELMPSSRRLPASISASYSAALLQAVQELDGAEHRQVAEALAAVLELLGGAGEEQLVQGAARRRRRAPPPARR